MKTGRVGFLVSGLMIPSCLALAQGSLTPAGPPGPTMRTLQQIEPRTPIDSLPFTISEPGSYYLAYGVSATEPTNSGIWITVSDVVLDLNNFTLAGGPGSSTHGIEVAPGANVAIRNGTIRNWGGNGIEAPEVANLVVENVVLKNNAGHGLHFSSGELDGVESHDNGGAGLFSTKPVPGVGIVVKRNPGSGARLNRNGGGGFVLAGDFDVEFSGVIHGNTGHGIAWAPATPTDGLRLKLEDCDSSHNTGDGLHLAGASSAEAWCEMADVSFSHNGGGGVFVSKPVPGIGIVVKKNPGSGARIANNGAGGLVLAGDCDVEFAGLVSDNVGHGISWEPLNPADRITFKAKEGASVHNTGDGLHFAASGPVDATCDLAEFSFERNGGDGVHIALPHPDSRLDYQHRQGRLLENTGDGANITAGRNGRQGFFDITAARNDGKGLNKVDGGSNPGIVERCVIQDNGDIGLNLEGGSWTLADSVIKGNGGDGVAVGARKYTKTGHVTILKRGGTAADNAGAGVRVYPLEDGAQIQVVVEDSSLAGNTGSGLEVEADRLGSGGAVSVRDSSVSGNGGSGISLASTASSTGLAYQIAGGDCDDNEKDGIAIMDPRVTGGTVHGTRVSGNAANGLDIEGGRVTLDSCDIHENGGDGVVVAAKEREKKGHVTLIKRTGSAERNGGNGVRVYAIEPGAECRVILDHSRLSGNGSNGLHVAAVPSGSSIALDWLDSSASGNGGSGMLIVPVAMDKGLRFRADGGDCDDNVAGGITVDGDGVDVCTVRGLSLRGNGAWGVNARGGIWRFADCTAADNPDGGFRMHKPIQVYRGRWGDFAFADCDAVANGMAGIAIYGFDVATTARVDIAGGRVAANTGVAGIDLSSSPGSKGRIHGVAVADNTGHGIYSEGSGWSITDNRVAGNGNTGIFVAGNGHHLARNELADNSIGIYLEGTGSAVRENTYSGMAPGGGLPQTPYVDGSGANAVAPLQNVAAGMNPLGNVEF